MPQYAVKNAIQQYRKLKGLDKSTAEETKDQLSDTHGGLEQLRL